MDNNNTYLEQEESEIDIMALVMKVWDKRKFIIKVTCCFIVLGIVAALMSTRKYTATRVFIPQSNSSSSRSGSLSSLASLAGISLGDGMQDGPMSPLVYPHILSNVAFQKDLMNTPINFDGISEPVSLYEYYTDPKYDKHPVKTAVLKYTIGLPGTVMSAIRGDKKHEDDVLGDGNTAGFEIAQMTKKEAKIAKSLKEKISLTVDKKEGYITITSTMPEPLAAAQLNEALFSLLRKYVTEFKVNKSQQYLDYIEMEHDQAKIEYETLQNQYAQYLDANRGLKTAVAEIEAERLKSEVTLANQLYTSLANNLLAAKVKVKEENVVFTDISPVSVPDQPVNSRKKTVIVWTFLGFILACGWVIGMDYLAKFKEQLASNGDSNRN